MDRRTFLIQAGVVGVVANANEAGSKGQESRDGDATTGSGGQTNNGVGCRPDETRMMEGSPPPAERQVTRENYEESQAKMRWAHQHWRELYPTQRIPCSARPVILARRTRDVAALQFSDTTGKPTTFEKQLQALDVDGVIMLTHGKIVCEEYFHGMRPDVPHSTRSVIKSIEATVIATLLDDGSLKEEGNIESYVKELRGTAYEGATVRHLLDMESGIKYDYGVGPQVEFARHTKSISPAARELGLPVGNYNYLPTLERERKHGDRMTYKEADPAALVWAAEKQSGRRFASLVQERIWSRIGAEFDADATCDQLGQWTFHLAVTLRDLARWGQMCVNDGAVNGQQVVPVAFFQDIRKNASVEKLAHSPLLGRLMPAGVGYRSLFYHQRESGDAFAAAGAYGQFCYMNPKYDTVVAMFSTTPPWTAEVATGAPFDVIFERDCRRERERWHLCHEMARILS